MLSRIAHDHSRVHSCIGAAALVFATMLISQPARAIAPFETDNASPIRPGHIHVYLEGTYQRLHRERDIGAPQFQIGYGAAKELELDLSLSAGVNRELDSPAAYGLGNLDFDAKYRMWSPPKKSWLPAFAVVPTLSVPVRQPQAHLGTGHTRLFLPVWLEEKWHGWKLSGGGGLWLNPGAGNRDWWFFGSALTHKITANLTLGGEIFHSTSAGVGVPPSTGFNLGGVYDLSSHHHLVFAAGRGLQNAHATNQFRLFAGYEATF